MNLMSFMMRDASSTLVNISATFVSSKRAVTFSKSATSSSMSFKMFEKVIKSQTQLERNCGSWKEFIAVGTSPPLVGKNAMKLEQCLKN